MKQSLLTLGNGSITLLVLLSIVLVSTESCTGCSRSAMAREREEQRVIDSLDSVQVDLTRHYKYQVMYPDGGIEWVVNMEDIVAKAGDSIVVKEWETEFMEAPRKVIYGRYIGKLPDNHIDTMAYIRFYSAVIIR